jgi:outer membrane protein OmpA-like peptidoglycan-associated protein
MTTMKFGNHPARTFATRISLLVFPALLSAAVLSSTAIGTEAGVSDFTVARPEQIQTMDIVEALAVARGTRIHASAPPTVRLPIFFEFDSAELLPEAEMLLGRVGAALMSDDLADFRFAVEGHTDSVGSAAYNARLSEERSRAVKAYLIAEGVPGHHLAARGHGEKRPAASNENDEGRQRNRRVEFINRGAAQ